MIVPAEIADRLLAECFGRPQAYHELGWLCDHVGGRISGASTGDQAEEWARALLQKWGLENVRLEGFPVQAWTRGTIDAQVLSPTGWRLTALAHGNAPTSADVTVPVVDVRHGEKEQFAERAAEVAGKIALCDEGASPGRRRLHRTEIVRFAVEHGAAGLMIMSSASGALSRTGVCYRRESPIPSVGISLEDGERLRRLLDRGAVPTVRLAMTNSMAEGTAHNVIAELPGTELPDEVVLAGGHLDSWDVAQGATDNGLGSAVVLEMARALAALGKRPRRTLRFALWAAEETGLHGSRHYAATRADELDSLVALMNFDMTGDPYGYWTPGRKDPAPLLRDLVRQLAPLGMREEFEHSAGLHSDHQPFMLAGVPVVCLMGRLPDEAGRYYHSVGDTFEKVSQAGLCRTAAAGALTMWAIADAPDRPWARLAAADVDAMIDEANLREAIGAEEGDR